MGEPFGAVKRMKPYSSKTAAKSRLAAHFSASELGAKQVGVALVLRMVSIGAMIGDMGILQPTTHGYAHLFLRDSLRAFGNK